MNRLEGYIYASNLNSVFNKSQYALKWFKLQRYSLTVNASLINHAVSGINLGRTVYHQG